MPKNKVPALDALGKVEVTPELAAKLFDKGRSFNAQIDLEASVKVNENFFIGKQWEGVKANGLPTPVFNVIKRVVSFIVATITTDNIKVTATPLAYTPDTNKLIEPARIINEEFEAIMERNAIPSLIREYTRDAAVRGDGCTFTYFDPNVETGQKSKGAIVTETVENTRVFFGNPNSKDVQSQPYIIITKRALVDEERAEAKANGVDNWDDIKPDVDEIDIDSAKRTDDKVTDILLLWRDRETGEVWAQRSAGGVAVKEPWNMGIRLYPVTWLNWDYVQDCYHGQAMVTGLIPNQITINKLWAMSAHSFMTTAFPKIVFDKTRVPKWDNRVGQAIGISGGDVNTVAKSMNPATIDPQVSQFMKLAVEQTEQTLGATSVALGDTRPDNTSAIIALQRAAATPSELTKQNLYRSIEDLFRIYIEFMAECYGKRAVDMPPPAELENVYAFLQQQPPSEIPVEYDFSQLKDMPMSMKLDVGASSYYSEIASIQTLDNLLRLKEIDIVQYLERVPDGYIPARRQLVLEIKNQRKQMQQMQQMQAQTAMPEDTPIAAPAQQTEIPTGGGYSALQRKVNETGTTQGEV